MMVMLAAKGCPWVGMKGQDAAAGELSASYMISVGKRCWIPLSRRWCQNIEHGGLVGLHAIRHPTRDGYLANSSNLEQPTTLCVILKEDETPGRALGRTTFLVTGCHSSLLCWWHSYCVAILYYREASESFFKGVQGCFAFALQGVSTVTPDTVVEHIQYSKVPRHLAK